MSENRYPLAWPIGHPRAAFRRESSFGTRANSRNRKTLAEVIGELQDELDRLGAKDVVLSSHLQLRLDGLPRGDSARPHDPGIAVYFTLGKTRKVMPCDKWDRPECNIMAVTKTIEAMRGLERWGSATMERAFAGYAALPERAAGPTWWDTLQTTPTATADEIEKAFRLLAKVAHPDVGGNVDRWHVLQEARDQGLMAVQGRVGA